MALDDIFHPRSIAVVGASAGPANIHTQMFLDSLIQFGYKGEIYPINPKSEPVFGLRTYPNLSEVPGPVDHVISLIPSRATPQLIRDSIAKGVKTVQFFTAGFAETGEEDGKRLQEELVVMARSGGVRIIGPNCVGIYCPESGMAYAADFPKETGRVGFVAQSGGYTYHVVRMAAVRGVRFSKVVSYGNASDISESDLLGYLADDPDTDIIGAYMEGTRDGRRLLRVLADAAARKPVIVIKRGGTDAGSRGTRSHTGSLAGDDRVWDAALKQAGAIRVEDVEEMVDLMATFSFLSLPRGRRVVVMGAGGGASVRASDECETGGLTLPPIPEEMRKELKRFIPLAGSMLRNPVDLLAESHGSDVMWIPVLETLEGWREADMLLWQMSPEMEPIRGKAFSEFMIGVRSGMLEAFKRLRKPKAVIIHAVETLPGFEELDAIRQKCGEYGIAFYPSLYRAARAISRYMDYHEWRDGHAGS